MWAESQLDKRRLKEETINKFNDSSFNVVVEGSQSPLGYPNNKNHGTSPTTLVKDDSAGIVDNLQNHFESIPAEKSSAAQETFVGQFAVPSGNTAERSRMQLKSFIGHKAEEMYVYRSLPLGQDRRRNRYWLFVASGSSEDPGSGRIFVESPHGCWKLIDTEEVCSFHYFLQCALLLVRQSMFSWLNIHFTQGKMLALFFFFLKKRGQPSAPRFVWGVQGWV